MLPALMGAVQRITLLSVFMAGECVAVRGGIYLLNVIAADQLVRVTVCRMLAWLAWFFLPVPAIGCMHRVVFTGRSILGGKNRRWYGGHQHRRA